MRRSLALVVLVALSMAACSRSLLPPPRPAVITSLVDAAPAGGTVSVAHYDKDPWGGFDAHWSVDVTGVPVEVAREAYQAWCEASPNGWTWDLNPDGEWGCSDISFRTFWDEDRLSATLYDDSPLAR